MTAANIRTGHRPSVEETMSEEKFVKTADSHSAESPGMRAVQKGRRGLSKDIAAYNEAATL